MTLSDSCPQKYFICNLDAAGCLGIPAGQTRQIIAAGGGGQASEGGGGFISLPALLGLNGDSAVHGIVLKTAADDDANANAEATAPPSVLLVPRVDIELEIAGEDIHPLPDVLSKMLKYFKGAHFAGEKLILILDTQKITEGYR